MFSGMTEHANALPPLTRRPLGAIAVAEGSLVDSKRCSKCAESKPLDQFNKERSKLRAYCKACHSRGVVQWQRDNPEKAKAKHLKWRRANGIAAPQPAMPRDEYAERRRQSRRKWEAANPDKMQQARAQWAEANPERLRAIVRHRQAKKAQRTPAWADREAMVAFYAEAKRLTDITGTKHEVDHIVPLNGENVCGLHWEGNLQVLTKAENRRKWHSHV
jgi:hypothetical protein